jgi:hypothetical protein
LDSDSGSGSGSTKARFGRNVRAADPGWVACIDCRRTQSRLLSLQTRFDSAGTREDCSCG